jgi:hypothetical protein
MGRRCKAKGRVENCELGHVGRTGCICTKELRLSNDTRIDAVKGKPYAVPMVEVPRPARKKAGGKKGALSVAAGAFWMDV